MQIKSNKILFYLIKKYIIENLNNITNHLIVHKYKIFIYLSLDHQPTPHLELHKLHQLQGLNNVHVVPVFHI